MRRYSLRKPAGHIITVDPRTERTVTSDTTRCVHCGCHDAVRDGSKRIRKFCGPCNGFTCTKQTCIEGCVPAEQQLDNIEAGRHPQAPRPVRILVP